MEYYLKKLCHQELGSIGKDGKANRGRYMFSSKDDNVLKMFPPLSRTQKNDSALLPIIPTYLNKKVYCNYVYHNDKYHGSTAAHPRDEYRIYLNSKLENGEFLFKKDDIVIIKKDFINLNYENIEEKIDETQRVYFLELLNDKSSELYKKCDLEIKESPIRGNYAIYKDRIEELEKKIENIKSNMSIDVAIDNSVIDKIENNEKTNQNNENKIADLFNSASFRDFVMVGYSNVCAITGSVISWNEFNNLESAHIMPKSHGGLYMPNNGIAMSRDIHWAFDKGFFTIGDDYRIIVHEEVNSDYLMSFNGKKINLPENPFFRPDKSNLKYHRENVFGLFKTRGRL